MMRCTCAKERRQSEDDDDEEEEEEKEEVWFSCRRDQGGVTPPDRLL